MTITELYELAIEAQYALNSMRGNMPVNHPLQGDVATLIKMVDTLQSRLLSANETYRMKLPV